MFETVIDEIAQLVQVALQRSCAGRDPSHRHPQILKAAAAVAKGVSSVVEALRPSLEG